MNDPTYVRCYVDNDKPEDVVKHYMLSPDFTRVYVPEIASYKDLQQFSMRGQACIGREKPVYHLKEVIPPVLDMAYDPHLGHTVDRKFYYCSWWDWPSGADQPGYMVISHPNGYEDFTYSGHVDHGRKYSSASFRGEVYKRVRDGNKWRYIVSAISYLPGSQRTNYDTLKSDWCYDVSAELYGKAASLISSCTTYAEAQALPAWKHGVFDYDPYYDRYSLTGNWIHEVELFDPKQDLELVARNHAIPVGLDAKLTSEAIANTSFNSNSLANLCDLFDAANKLRKGDFASLLLDFRKGGKVAADAWLKYRYVYSTTRADLEELVRYKTNGEPTVCRAGEQTAAGLMHVKIKLAPKSNQLGKIVDRLTGVGLAPNAYNMWDLVPFSFVVDWFVGIGDFLEGITQYGRVAAYDIMSVTTSWNWEDVISKSKTRAKFTFYERTVSPSAPAYVPYVEGRSASGETILKRCADTVALIGG
jgi:hypothetical protein